MKYLPKYTINEKIRNNIQEIEKLKNKIQGNCLFPETEASIRLRASVESIHSSTSIEGNPLNTNEIRAIITSNKVLTKAEYAEIEVQNYKNALDYINQRRYSNSDITMADILELHRIITDRLLDKTRNGKIRKNPIYIETQNHQILYTAINANKIQTALDELVNWIKASQFQIHHIIIAAIIHFRIAAIHPFSDGNGRTARALTSLFLALNQYDHNGLLALDSYYASDRTAYYAILRFLNGKNYHTSTQADLTPWLEYFTDGFLTSLHILDAEIRIINLSLSSRHQIPDLDREQQDILSYASKFGSISISEAEQFLPEISRRSVQRKLQQLVDSGHLKITGKARNTKYILNHQ